VVANGCVVGQTCGTTADRRKGLTDAPHGLPTGRRTDVGYQQLCRILFSSKIKEIHEVRKDPCVMPNIIYSFGCAIQHTSRGIKRAVRTFPTNPAKAFCHGSE
jgi:hypothetical protein